MSVVKLADGQKFTIGQPQEGTAVMRGRQRRTLELTFDEKQERFAAIRAAFSEKNLASVTVYYPENETALASDAQLTGVACKEFAAFSIVSEWIDREGEVKPATSTAPAVYERRLSVMLGERLFGE